MFQRERSEEHVLYYVVGICSLGNIVAPGQWLKKKKRGLENTYVRSS